jgi:hypothetical protein
MLEGKEVDVKLGSIGSLSVDLTPDLHLEVAVAAKVDLYAEIVKVAAKTKTPIDDGAAAFIGKMFGRDPAQVLADAGAAAAAIAVV